ARYQSHSCLSHQLFSVFFFFFFVCSGPPRHLHSFPTRRSSDLGRAGERQISLLERVDSGRIDGLPVVRVAETAESVEILESETRSEEHTSELQSRENLVCRLLLEKKKEID